MTDSIIKKIIIIAGPNGSGKTTFALEYLPKEGECPTFVNADLIAKGLSPFNPDLVAFKAGRIMLNEIDKHVSKGDNFAFETTLSGHSYTNRIKKWRHNGYRVKLVFLKIDTPELAIERVQTRVRQGGHNIPEAVIRRRFKAGLKNLEEVYKSIVDGWIIYDNTGLTPVMIERSRENEP